MYNINKIGSFLSNEYIGFMGWLEKGINELITKIAQSIFGKINTDSKAAVECVPIVVEADKSKNNSKNFTSKIKKLKNQFKRKKESIEEGILRLGRTDQMALHINNEIQLAKNDLIHLKQAVQNIKNSCEELSLIAQINTLNDNIETLLKKLSNTNNVIGYVEKLYRPLKRELDAIEKEINKDILSKNLDRESLTCFFKFLYGRLQDLKDKVNDKNNGIIRYVELPEIGLEIKEFFKQIEKVELAIILKAEDISKNT